MDACACLTMNGVGKPCAGEPHARFDRGPLETAGVHIGDLELRQSDDPSLGHRQSPMRSTAQPAAYLTTPPPARYRHMPVGLPRSRLAFRGCRPDARVETESTL